MSVAEIVFSDDVASRLKAAARVRGITVEAFIAESVDIRLAAEQQIAHLAERAARSDVRSAIELARTAPDVPPEDGDEMPADTDNALRVRTDQNRGGGTL